MSIRAFDAAVCPTPDQLAQLRADGYAMAIGYLGGPQAARVWTPADWDSCRAAGFSTRGYWVAFHPGPGEGTAAVSAARDAGALPHVGLDVEGVIDQVTHGQWAREVRAAGATPFLYGQQEMIDAERGLFDLAVVSAWLMFPPADPEPFDSVTGWQYTRGRLEAGAHINCDVLPDVFGGDDVALSPDQTRVLDELVAVDSYFAGLPAGQPQSLTAYFQLLTRDDQDLQGVRDLVDYMREHGLSTSQLLQRDEASVADLAQRVARLEADAETRAASPPAVVSPPPDGAAGQEQQQQQQGGGTTGQDAPRDATAASAAPPAPAVEVAAVGPPATPAGQRVVALPPPPPAADDAGA